MSMESAFYQSIQIFVNKPHVINKRLWGSKTLCQKKCRPKQIGWTEPFDCSKFQENDNCEDYCLHVIESLQLDLQNENSEDKFFIEITIIELFPKAYTECHSFQLIILNKDKLKATFYDITPLSYAQKLCPNFTYTIFLDDGEITLKTEADPNSKSYQWLKQTVLPQFIKWVQTPTNDLNQNIPIESLNLVQKENYYKKYNDLKIKYGKEMVKIWPECTDPSKFVYEDVAIASYLLILWEEETCLKKQKFVDLGCGNGLLVYILAQEGYQGVGIDIRKRQIWDLYSDNVKLQEKTIVPSDTHLFPKADWIIGNHSDELTPWIPVIAGQSSYKCNFFLLPCCAFNFNGTKYQRHDSSKSQYTEYLQYVKELSNSCGFQTEMDRLKIPSTKRICLVGRHRTYPEEHFDKYCNTIIDIVKRENGINLEKKNSDSWINDFKAREKVERVRNCTQIDQKLLNSIIDCITTYMLSNCVDWNNGKSIDIYKLIPLIPQSDLKSLKSECGGLQTLLRNNHHIFKVQSGKVSFRYPKTVAEVIKDSKNKNIKIKQKPCWFFNNHPQGCPLTDVNCSFLHDKII